MPYRGDYIGGYGRGDPGFFGNLVRGVAHMATGVVGGFLTGGPAGAVRGAIGGGLSAIKSNVRATTLEAGDQAPVDIRALHMAAIHHHQSATKAIGGSVVGTPHGPKMSMIRAAGGGGDGGRGYHLDKRTQSYYVRNRSMNPYNPRALKRAERRVGRFVKMATHLIRWVHPHKVGHAAPKIPRGRKK